MGNPGSTLFIDIATENIQKPKKLVTGTPGSTLFIDIATEKVQQFKKLVMGNPGSTLFIDIATEKVQQIQKTSHGEPRKHTFHRDSHGKRSTNQKNVMMLHPVCRFLIDIVIEKRQTHANHMFAQIVGISRVSSI